MTAQPLTSITLSNMQMLSLAGGGNRCWWQAGLLSYLLEQGWQPPPKIVATSAGAGIAAACITGGLETALQACLQLYADNRRIFDWMSLIRLKTNFAHQHIYPNWIRAFVHTESFNRLLQHNTSLLVAVTRPSKLLGLTASVALGTLAYLIDKKVWHSIHPKLPRYLGLKQDFIKLRQCSTAEDAQRLLLAAAAAPPIMNAIRWPNQWAFDGGYTDNAPIPTQCVEERQSTLVLLTRHYPAKPSYFMLNGRHYWQPSRRVPVSTWDCTSKTTVSAAYALGYEDAQRAHQLGWVCVP